MFVYAFDCDVFVPLRNKIQYKNNNKLTVDIEYLLLVKTVRNRLLTVFVYINLVPERF